jgi:hypothetical protein
MNSFSKGKMVSEFKSLIVNQGYYYEKFQNFFVI